MSEALVQPGPAVTIWVLLEPDSSCSHFLPRVFLALVEEAEDRGAVVAQGGGKVRGQAVGLCHAWGSGEGSEGWLWFGRVLHWLPLT